MKQHGGDLPRDFISLYLHQVQFVILSSFTVDESYGFVANQLLIVNEEARAWIIRNLLEKDGLFKLSNEEIDTICNMTEGIYSTTYYTG
jgi:hypothetical protein